MHSLRPTLQNSTDVPLTTKHRVTIWSSNSTSGSDGKESACNAGHLGLILGAGRSPGEDHGNPLQYSCQENPMDRRAWQAAGHRVAKSQTKLKQLTTARNSMSGYIAWRTESRGLKRDVYTHVPCIIYNSQEIEATRVSIDGWLDKQNEVYTYNAISFSPKKEVNCATSYNMNVGEWRSFPLPF